KFDEAGFGDAGNDFRQRGLAHPWRSPEDDGSRIIALDLQPQRLARSQNMLLANEFLQRARTHAVGQRTRKIRGRLRHANWLKQTQLILCLDASYSTIDAATPAFSDSTLRECGTTTAASAESAICRGTPAP